MNDLSEHILKELKKKNPSLSFIREKMNNREKHIQILNSLKQNQMEMKLSKFELDSLHLLFRTFISMNEQIQSKISTLLDIQIEKLAVATKQLKARESYGVSKTPKISYF